MIRIAVVHRGRALPLAWRVLAHPSASVAFGAYEHLLLQASQCLPPGMKVVLLADRGFIHTDAMDFVCKHLNWHYRIRLKSDTWIWRVGKGWHQLHEFHFKAGEALCFHNVKLHKGQWFSPVHLILGHNSLNGEFWAVASDEFTAFMSFAEYGLHFDIEEACLDDQSNRWNLQKSDLRSVCAFSQLFFILAVATLYGKAQGVEIVETGKRRWVDTRWFRGNSYFRIGWQ